MFRVLSSALGAVGLCGFATIAQEIGLPEITEPGAIGLAGYLVWWALRRWNKDRDEARETLKTEREEARREREERDEQHRAERKELVDTIKAMNERDSELREKDIEGREALIMTLKQRPCMVEKED